VFVSPKHRAQKWSSPLPESPLSSSSSSTQLPDVNERRPSIPVMLNSGLLSPPQFGMFLGFPKKSLQHHNQQQQQQLLPVTLPFDIERDGWLIDNDKNIASSNHNDLDQNRHKNEIIVTYTSSSQSSSQSSSISSTRSPSRTSTSKPKPSPSVNQWQTAANDSSSMSLSSPPSHFTVPATLFADTFVAPENGSAVIPMKMTAPLVTKASITGTVTSNLDNKNDSDDNSNDNIQHCQSPFTIDDYVAYTASPFVHSDDSEEGSFAVADDYIERYTNQGDNCMMNDNDDNVDDSVPRSLFS
jgi:hypothetical protein